MLRYIYWPNKWNQRPTSDSIEMAETASFVIGVIGIVGVIGAFKDTIDLFNNFMSLREFGRDYEMLDAKVEIEKNTLLQWAHQVRLQKPDYDRRLDDKYIQHAVIKILGCIRLLMGDEKELRTRYGLQKHENQRGGDENESREVINSPQKSKIDQ